MTDTARRCLHEACTCVATDGDYCSEYCRANTGKETITCACGHLDCAGTIDATDEAVG